MRTHVLYHAKNSFTPPPLLSLPFSYLRFPSHPFLSLSHLALTLHPTFFRDGSVPVQSSIPGQNLHTNSCESQINSRTPTPTSRPTSISTSNIGRCCASASASADSADSGSVFVSTHHVFGEGTCFPGRKSELHSTVSRSIPLTSPLCGLLRDLPFEKIVDLAYMFNYNDDER